MRKEVEKAMEEGCRGLSVGRDYVPGFFADKEELFACAKVAAKYGGVYTSHSLRTGLRVDRPPGQAPPAKIQGIMEAIEVGRKAKIPVQISHLGPLYDVWPPGNKLISESAVKATLKAIDEARGEGVDVSFDLIPHHTAGGIYSGPYVVGALLPWLRVTGSREALAEALRLGQLREEVKETIKSGKWYGLNPNINPGWAHRPTIVEHKEERFRDKTAAQIAEELDVEPLDALFQVIRADPDTKFMVKGDDDSVKLMFYRHPQAMIGIDTFAVDDTWEIKSPPWFLPNENSYGGFPRYFRRAVRETNTLTLEEAVRKVTSLPAAKFKLSDRGILKSGAHADIVIMNPETVTDRGNALRPRVYPEGIEHVIVNGIQVIERGRHTGALPGKVLYQE
jgi:N-acyl-D-aspartate/D-glutamate deacylase